MTRGYTIHAFYNLKCFLIAELSVNKMFGFFKKNPLVHWIEAIVYLGMWKVLPTMEK